MMRMIKTINKTESGQAMFLTILAIGGAILGATTIGGILILNQTRATTDIMHSAQAIFAADTGIGWAEFDYFCGSAVPTNCVQAGEQPKPTFSSGINATFSAICYDASNNPLPNCSDTSTVATVISKGQSLNSIRAFFLEFTTSTIP